MTHTTPTPEARPAAKAVLYTPDNRFLMTLGGRTLAQGGRWNLPGGGIEHGERLDEALFRELQEELGPGFAPEALNFRRANGTIEGDVTGRSGSALRAQWTVFTAPLPSGMAARLLGERTRLMDGYDIVRGLHDPRQEVSRLAARAVLEYGLPELGAR